MTTPIPAMQIAAQFGDAAAAIAGLSPGSARQRAAADADRLRATALGRLADALRAFGYRVVVEAWHLTICSGGQVVEVWAQKRGGCLWFTWAGGRPICSADEPAAAVAAVEALLRTGCVPS
jgi:hypothetical protein